VQGGVQPGQGKAHKMAVVSETTRKRSLIIAIAITLITGIK
jgi:hypothetical protein